MEMNIGIVVISVLTWIATWAILHFSIKYDRRNKP
jgi:hypothetical protein